MKVMISHSATKAKIANGARVAAEFNKNEWSLGTVVKGTPTTYTVDFDFGEVHLLKTAKIRILEVNQKKKSKKPLKYSEVRAISVVALAKAEKAAAAKAEEDARLKKEKKEKDDERRKAHGMKRARELSEQLKVQYREDSKPAIRSLRKWAEFRHFKMEFFAEGYPYGFWIIEDRKLRLHAYLYKTVLIYALPPSKPGVDDANTEDPEIDNIEYGKLELPYDKFNVKALQTWIESLAAEHGFKFQYLTKPPVVLRVPTQKPSTVPAQKPGIKIAAKPISKPAAVSKPGIKLKV